MMTNRFNESCESTVRLLRRGLIAGSLSTQGLQQFSESSESSFNFLRGEIKNPIYVNIYSRDLENSHFSHWQDKTPIKSMAAAMRVHSSALTVVSLLSLIRGINAMDYYIRYFYDYCDGHETEADRVIDYISDYLIRQSEINRDIGTREIHQHCENCLDIAIPYEAFLGALIYCRYQLSTIGQNVFVNLSDRSPLLMIRSGKPFSRRNPEICQVIRYYGQRGLDPTLFNKRFGDAEHLMNTTSKGGE